MGGGWVVAGRIQGRGEGPPNRPHDQTWRLKVLDVRMPARISRLHAINTAISSRCIRDVVVTVAESRSKRCLPSLKYYSGCMRRPYISTTNLGSDNEVAKYHGSLCPLLQNNTILAETAWSWRYCAALMKTKRCLRRGWSRSLPLNVSA